MATVDSEILVGCQDDGISKGFGHANEASIGEAHGNVGVFLDQLRDRLYVFGKFEGDNQGTAAKQCAKTWRASPSEKVIRFGQNRFAGPPRRRQTGRLSHGPLVVNVAVAKQCHHKTSVNEDVSCHSLWIANTPSCAQLDRWVGCQPIQ